MADPVVAYVLTPHALEEIGRRGLDEALIRRVLAAPEERMTVRPGRDILQAQAEMEGRPYLVRVVVDVDRRRRKSSPPTARARSASIRGRVDESDL